MLRTTWPLYGAVAKPRILPATSVAILAVGWRNGLIASTPPLRSDCRIRFNASYLTPLRALSLMHGLELYRADLATDVPG